MWKFVAAWVQEGLKHDTNSERSWVLCHCPNSARALTERNLPLYICAEADIQVLMVLDNYSLYYHWGTSHLNVGTVLYNWMGCILIISDEEIMLKFLFLWDIYPLSYGIAHLSHLAVIA